VLDSFTKQSLALEVDTSFPSRRVTRVLDKAIGRVALMRLIRGPIFCCRKRSLGLKMPLQMIEFGFSASLETMN